MNSGKYDVIDIANYIINYCIDQNMPISNLKLQKLLYYVQVASLVENNTPMFKEEICAWKYGPVVENVYHTFKWHVDKAIAERITTKCDFFEDINEDFYDPAALIASEDKTLVNKVVESYKNFTALNMVKKTHNEDPWKDAFHSNSEYIEKKVLQSFYSQESNRLLIYGE